MFALRYMASELRRRKGRTVLTALGLGLGVALVVAVGALSTGLDRAQTRILEPLTGVGTDLSATRPIRFSSGGSAGAGPGFPRLSAKEREQLEQENGPARFGLRSAGEPGTRFTRDAFVSTSQLSFPASEVREIAGLDGVAAAAGGLTLNALHVEGTVPERPAGDARGFAQPAPPGGPEGIDATALSVAGVDRRFPALGAVTGGQIVQGRYFSASPPVREAIVGEAYARREAVSPGDTVKLAGKRFRVVGVARAPLGGQASDVYVGLAELQAMSGRKERVNTVYVRATSAERVGAVAGAIEAQLAGASVTTAKDLADRVSGSLVDADGLVDRLGLALAAIGLFAAFAFAALLTLGSVAKRVRELGTLRAIGWPRRHVVRQVTGEAVLQSVLGAAIGIALGIGGAALVEAVAPALEASVERTQSQGPILAGPFGQGAVASAPTSVPLDAPVDARLLAAATLLALAGGLLAGAAGSLRAARLRPAEALRRVD
jgi:ABC-type antimicrobial peptide transport system permease subunit